VSMGQPSGFNELASDRVLFTNLLPLSLALSPGERGERN